MIDEHHCSVPGPAWAQAYEENAERLMRLATVLVGRDEAGDLVADTVSRVVGAPGWPDVQNPAAYLVRSLVNGAISRRRTDHRRRSREERVSAVPRGRHLDPGDALDVRAALARLSPQQRAVVFLAYWEDRTIADIAAALDVTEGTVRRQLDRAKSRLREVLR